MPHNNYQSFYKSLSPDELHFYNLYKLNTGAFAYNLNTLLRNKSPLSTYTQAISNLDNLILKYVHPFEITLYRACTTNLVDPFIDGSIYTNPDYLSTAILLERCQKHFTTPENPALLIFKCSANMSMAPMDLNEEHGESEDEMLLGRSNRFRLKEKTVVTERNEIERTMGRFEALGVKELVIYNFII